MRVRVVPDRSSKVVLTADGQTGVAITPEDSVLVRKADVCAKFVKLGPEEFLPGAGSAAKLSCTASSSPHHLIILAADFWEKALG